MQITSDMRRKLIASNTAMLVLFAFLWFLNRSTLSFFVLLAILLLTDTVRVYSWRRKLRMYDRSIESPTESEYHYDRDRRC